MSAPRLWTLLWAPRRFLFHEVAEPAFDLVGPRGTGRGEVHVKPRVAGESGADGRSLVGPVVVADQVRVQFDWHGLVDGGQELLELGGAVLAVQFADRGAVDDVERRGERLVIPLRA